MSGVQRIVFIDPFALVIWRIINAVGRYIVIIFWLTGAGKAQGFHGSVYVGFFQKLIREHKIQQSTVVVDHLNFFCQLLPQLFGKTEFLCGEITNDRMQKCAVRFIPTLVMDHVVDQSFQTGFFGVCTY